MTPREVLLVRLHFSSYGQSEVLSLWKQDPRLGWLALKGFYWKKPGKNRDAGQNEIETVQEAFHCSFQSVHFSNCSLTWIAPSERKWHNELESLVPFGKKVNHQSAVHNRQYSAYTKYLPLSRVAYGSLRVKGVRPSEETPFGVSHLSLIFTHVHQSLFGDLKQRCWPRFEINIDQQLHTPAVTSLLSNTGDNLPTG